MNAGAPVKYRTSGDDPNEEPECLLGSIGWKISGAWMVDKDYAWANILEAYYACLLYTSREEFSLLLSGGLLGKRSKAVALKTASYSCPL